MLTFDGWQMERFEDANAVRLDGFVEGFALVSGTNNSGRYEFGAVRVFVYRKENTMSDQELVPWHDGEEVYGAPLPADLKERIHLFLKAHPYPEKR